MPIFDYTCSNGHTTEELFFSDEEIPVIISCEMCNEKAHKQMVLIARMADQWNDHPHGVNGTYNRGLGQVIYNERHRQQVMKARGLVDMRDFNNEHMIEDHIVDAKQKKQEKDKFYDTYKDALKKHDGDHERAQVEVMPAKECLSGKFDSLTDT